MTLQLALKRAYEPVHGSDGRRVLVDRLWPRGLRKGQAQVDTWAKDVAPSTELRKWFGHDPARWGAFQERYVQELQANPQVKLLATLLASMRAVFPSRAAQWCSRSAACRLAGTLGKPGMMCGAP